jgi:hypothetical protein
MYGHRDYKKGVFVEPKGLVSTPYPIGFASQILIPSGWTFGNFGHTYKIPRWGLRPYGPFISNYYSNLGWCYQRRRTWHGIIYSAIRPPISVNKKTVFQLGYQGKFRNGVVVWQGMSESTKNIYKAWRYPAHASGYNRFLRWYLLHTPAVFVFGDVLLMEDGFDLLQETGSHILLEKNYILTEVSENLTTESAEKLTTE